MKNNILTRTCIGLFLFSVFACVGAERQKDFLSTNIEYAAVQYGLQIDALEKNDKILIPRTVNAKGDMVYARRGWDWTLGFFPKPLVFV